MAFLCRCNVDNGSSNVISGAYCFHKEHNNLINLDEQEATNIATGAQLESTRNDLAAKELALQETQLDLETKQTILVMLENELAAKEISLSLLENELVAKQAALELSEEEAANLENLILILAEQQAALEAQKQELLSLIALNTIELESMRSESCCNAGRYIRKGQNH